MTTPEGPRTPDQPYDDAEDRLMNQAGSYADAHFWDGTLEPSKPTERTWEEIEADKAKPPQKPLTTAQRRRIARIASGPQYGEDSLDVSDQSQDPSGMKNLRQKSREVSDVQFESRVARERAAATSRGENPDATERLLRDRRQEFIDSVRSRDPSVDE